MGILTAIKRDAPEPQTLDDALIDMCRYGQPRLSLLDGGWYCKIAMHVAAKGASFDIASDFGQRTPREAVDQCRARIRETIAQLAQTHDA